MTTGHHDYKEWVRQIVESTAGLIVPEPSPHVNRLAIVTPLSPIVAAFPEPLLSSKSPDASLVNVKNVNVS